MKAYILQRVLSLIPVLLTVAIVVFFIMHLIPGDPASVMLGADATEDDIDRLREELGLNLPMYEQFFNWVFGLLQGDLGMSIYMKEPVLQVFMNHLGPTLSLAILAQGISILIAIPMGIIAAKNGERAQTKFSWWVLCWEFPCQAFSLHYYYLYFSQ